jgi:hypothetical protein
MQQYFADGVEFSWNGLDLKEGLVEGTFLQESQAAPRTSKKSGAVGNVTRTFQGDKSGSLTCTIDRESRTHQKLISLAQQDAKTRDQVAEGRLNDTGLGMVVSYKNMYIQTIPDEAWATTGGTVAWVLEYESKDPTPTDGNANVVGD